MGISRDALEQLRSTLKAAPKVTPTSGDVTKQEAVKSLVREIQGLQKRGYSLEQVAEMLREGRLIVMTPTLKSYLSRAKAGRERGKVAGPRKKAAGGAKTPAAAGVAPALRVSVATSAASQVTRKDGGVTACGVPASDAVDDAAVKPAVAPAVADELKAEMADPSKLRSGKGAFLIKDKDTY